jgi:hypothetical protein
LPPGKVGRHHLGGVQPAFRSCLHRLCASLLLVSFGDGFLGFLVCKRHSFSDLWLLVSSSAFASDCAFCEIFFFFFLVCVFNLDLFALFRFFSPCKSLERECVYVCFVAMSMMFAPRLTEAAAPTTHAAPTWSPYDNNGGTCVAIAGEDYCVIAADTRMSTGFSILTRNHSKIHQITDKSVLASSGFQADIRALQKNLDARHQIYQHQHSKQMSCPAMAQLLSNTLYYKRFFPYYAFNVLGGLDSEGPNALPLFLFLLISNSLWQVQQKCVECLVLGGCIVNTIELQQF